MCLCKENNWCRDLSDGTHGGKYPISDHHPACDEYRLEEFTILEHDGVRCIMEKHEADEVVREGDEEYTVSSVLLTRDQFENIPEFQGF